MKRALISLMFIFLMCGAIYAEEEKPPVILAAFPVNISLVNMPPDDRGTDVTNIYTIVVNFADPKYATNAAYKIVYFEDDRLAETFDSKTLPFSMMRNYKGFVPGDHTIKFHIMDGLGNILTAQTATIHVKQGIK